MDDETDADQPVDDWPQPDEAAGVDGYDPGGVDVALDLMADLASVLPPPRFGPAPGGGKKRPPARSSGQLTAVGDVVGQMATEYGWRDGITLQFLKARWPQLVGDGNAQHSAPERLHDKVLTVGADSTTWASALRLLAPQLVARLNDALGEQSVTRVDVHGPAGPSWKHGPRVVRNGRGPRDTYG